MTANDMKPKRQPYSFDYTCKTAWGHYSHLAQSPSGTGLLHVGCVNGDAIKHNEWWQMHSFASDSRSSYIPCFMETMSKWQKHFTPISSAVHDYAEMSKWKFRDSKHTRPKSKVQSSFLSKYSIISSYTHLNVRCGREKRDQWMGHWNR